MTCPDTSLTVQSVTEAEVEAAARALCRKKAQDQRIGGYAVSPDFIDRIVEALWPDYATAARAALKAAAQARPAPAEGGEVERLLAEREQIALAICGGEDAPGYALSLSVDDLKRVVADRLESKEWCDTQIASLAAAETALTTAREEALEEAAKVAEATPRHVTVPGSYWDTAEGQSFPESRSATFVDVARRIRALAAETRKGWDDE